MWLLVKFHPKSSYSENYFAYPAFNIHKNHNLFFFKWTLSHCSLLFSMYRRKIYKATMQRSTQMVAFPPCSFSCASANGWRHSIPMCECHCFCVFFVFPCNTLTTSWRKGLRGEKHKPAHRGQDGQAVKNLIRGWCASSIVPLLHGGCMWQRPEGMCVQWLWRHRDAGTHTRWGQAGENRIDLRCN